MDILFWILFIILTILFLCLVFEENLPDPVKECPVYKYEGCSHVDGPDCNMEDCPLIRKFNEKHSEAGDNKTSDN